MKEPILIAELLISGLLTLTWSVLGLAFFIGLNPMLTAIPQMGIAGVTILALYCYIIGIVTDRIWDILTKPTDRRIRRTYFETDDVLNAGRSRVLATNAERFQFFDYIRMRMRVTRAVVCNAPLITAAVGLLLWKAGALISPGGIYLLASLLLFTIASNYAFVRISHNYYKQLKHAIDAEN